MFGGRWRREREARKAALLALSAGPVDVDGIRSVIADVLASVPPGAGEVRESNERIHQYPERPDPDLDCLRLHVLPRAVGAVDMTIDVFESYGRVDVFVGTDVIELTAPININEVPPRPFLDVIRDVLNVISSGEIDVGRWPGGESVAVSFWREEERKTYGVPDEEGITWSAGSPWS